MKPKGEKTFRPAPEEVPAQPETEAEKEILEPTVEAEDMPVVRMPEPPKDQSLYVLLGVTGFVIVMMLISYIFFKMEQK